MLDQGVIQAMDEKSQTDIEVLDDLKIFSNIFLWQVIWTHCSIFIMSASYGYNEQHFCNIMRNSIKEVLLPKNYHSSCKREEMISIDAFDLSSYYVYWNPRVFSTPNRLIPSTWVYGIYNTATFGTFEEVISKDQVSIMSWCSIINTKIAVRNVPMKENIKTHVISSMPCDIEILS